MSAVRQFTEERIKKFEMEEYFREELAQAEYGEMDFSSSSTQGVEITLKVGRVGYAIGKRGRTIKKISSEVRAKLNDPRANLEIEQLSEPELNSFVMASKLASALERGRHFRRSAHGIVRRIMSKGAVGVEITVSGKITSQRARVEKFRDGFIAKTGDPKRKFLSVGFAKAKIKRGILGISVSIMSPKTVLPDEINIITEPTHDSRDFLISGSSDSETILEEITEEFSKEELDSDQFEDLNVPAEIKNVEVLGERDMNETSDIDELVEVEDKSEMTSVEDSGTTSDLEKNDSSKNSEKDKNVSVDIPKPDTSSVPNSEEENKKEQEE